MSERKSHRLIVALVSINHHTFLESKSFAVGVIRKNREKSRGSFAFENLSPLCSLIEVTPMHLTPARSFW
jgi:hypothetical protein